jgi:integrase
LLFAKEELMGCIYRRKKRLSDGRVVETGPYWIKYYRNGRPMSESTESEKESDAKRLLRLREGDIERGVAITPRVGRVRVEELIQDLITEYRTNGRRSLNEVERRCRKHLLPFFGGRRASSVTTADVRRFIEARQKVEASNGEINRELAALKRAYSLAIHGGTLLTKPYIPMLEENNVRQGFFERDQFELVRSLLPKDLQAVVTFAYITGWRTNSEILPLQWRQVDFESGAVRLDPGTTKNKEGRLFPFKIDNELVAVLESQKAKAEKLRRDHGTICPWVFHRDSVQIKSYYGSWRKACNDAGLPGRIPHDFRRTAVRNLEQAGVSRSVAMRLTGHKTETIYRRYAIVSESDLSDAVTKLQRLKELKAKAFCGYNRSYRCT